MTNSFKNDENNSKIRKSLTSNEAVIEKINQNNKSMKSEDIKIPLGRYFYIKL